MNSFTNSTPFLFNQLAGGAGAEFPVSVASKRRWTQANPFSLPRSIRRADLSIHSDIWRGSAAELAERDAIGVFSISGWWKEKPALQRWDRSARYALIVSVRAPGANIDIYTPIANKLEIPIPAG